MHVLHGRYGMRLLGANLLGDHVRRLLDGGDLLSSCDAADVMR